MLELVHLQRSLTSCLVEDLRAFLKITWHCIKFVEGSCIFKPNFVLERKMVVRVALIIIITNLFTVGKKRSLK